MPAEVERRGDDLRLGAQGSDEDGRGDGNRRHGLWLRCGRRKNGLQREMLQAVWGFVTMIPELGHCRVR